MRSILLFTLLIGSAFCAHAQAQRQLFTQWIETLNTNDAGEYKRFSDELVAAGLQEYDPPQLMMDLHNELGEITFVKADYSSATKYAATVSAGDKTYGFVIGLGVENSVLKLRGYSYTPLNEWRDFSQEEFKAYALKVIEEKTSKDSFSGNVLIKRGNEVLVAESIAEASKELGIENDISMRYNTGSITKVFTSLAVHILADKGAIKLEEKISKYYPEVRNSSLSTEVTIRDLLRHESGLGDVLFNDRNQLISKWKFNSYRDFIPLIFEENNLGEYGEFRYSNSGYLLLGDIIEKVSGQSYDDFVKTEILDRVGMNNTKPEDQSGLVKKGATGYTKLTAQVTGDRLEFERDPDSEWRKYNPFSYGFSTPAGGYYATLGDLEKLMSAIVRGDLISERMKESMQTHYNYFSTFQYGQARGYGAGLVLSQYGKYQSIGHGGTAPGWSCEMHYISELDLTLILTSNYDRLEGAQSLFRKIMDYFRN